jgi:hypothetical protein
LFDYSNTSHQQQQKHGIFLEDLIKGKAAELHMMPSTVALEFCSFMLDKSEQQYEESKKLKRIAHSAAEVAYTFEKQEQAETEEEEDDEEEEEEEVITARLIKRNPVRNCRMNHHYFAKTGVVKKNEKMKRFKPY